MTDISTDTLVIRYCQLSQDLETLTEIEVLRTIANKSPERRAIEKQIDDIWEALVLRGVLG